MNRQAQSVSSKAFAIAGWLISLLVAVFYLTSALGWFLSTYLVYSGLLGEEGRALVDRFTIGDQVIRTAQVLMVSIASLLLVWRKQLALVLFLIVLALSAVATLFVRAWTVSFIGGILPLALLAAMSTYAYCLRRRHVLR